MTRSSHTSDPARSVMKDLKTIEEYFKSVFTNHTSASRVKSAIREDSTALDEEETFSIQKQKWRIRNNVGSTVVVQRTEDIRASAPEIAQRVTGSFNPKVPFIDKRLRLCLISQATTSSEHVNRPGIETSLDVGPKWLSPMTRLYRDTNTKRLENVLRPRTAAQHEHAEKSQQRHEIMRNLGIHITTFVPQSRAKNVASEISLENLQQISSLSLESFRAASFTK